MPASKSTRSYGGREYESIEAEGTALEFIPSLG